MSMNESTCTQYYHKKLRAEGIYCLKLCLQHESGVPDSWICGTKDNIWIEFKWIKELPKRWNTIIKSKLSPLQTKWILDRQCHHVKIITIYCSPDGDVIHYGTNQNVTSAFFKEIMTSRKQAIKCVTNLVNH